VDGENSNYLNDSINQLENLIIDVKSSPKPSFGQRIKIVVLTYFTLGLYLVYRKFAYKKGDSFDNLVAKCERESRMIKVKYGDDKKVRLLLEELNDEIEKIGKNRKKLTLGTNLGCLGVLIIFIAIYAIMAIWSFNQSGKYLNSDNANKIDSLISIGAIDEAKQEAYKIILDYEKKDAFDKIYIYEIDQHILKNEIELAKNKVNTINSKHKREKNMDKIIMIEINNLLEENKLADAKYKAQLINSEYDRDDVLKRINSLK
jgi:hypothetical protein